MPKTIAICSGFVACLVASVPALGGPELLFEATSKRVLHASMFDQPWFPASLTKLMTAYLVFEDLKAHKIEPKDKVTVSAEAHRRPRARLGIKTGTELTYDEALSALILLSANDIAVALAEARAGSETAFVGRMNATAQRLGMTSTHFINANGLPGEGQQSTARDLATLTMALIEEFPQQTNLFAMKSATVAGRPIGNHNPTLSAVAGGDGMKTGYTCSAGYNIVGSATRGEKRIVVIVLGEESQRSRAKKTTSLIEQGFRDLDAPGETRRPTLDQLPFEQFESELVRARNLDKRISDCKDPEPVLVCEDAGSSKQKPAKKHANPEQGSVSSAAIDRNVDDCSPKAVPKSKVQKQKVAGRQVGRPADVKRPARRAAPRDD